MNTNYGGGIVEKENSEKKVSSDQPRRDRSIRVTTLCVPNYSVYQTNRGMGDIEHPVYGRKLTKAQQTEMFGDAGGRRGIVTSPDGRVKYIYVTVGAGSKYKNEVTRDIIKYCFSRAPLDNRPMMEAFTRGDLIPVKLVPNHSTETFYWGHGKVTATDDVYYMGMTPQSRFVIQRVVPEDETKEEEAPAPPSRPRKRQIVEDDEEEREENQAPPTRTERMSSGSEPSSSLIPADVTRALSNVEFDSLLEKRHAAMMTRLGMRWSRVPPTIHNVSLSDGMSHSYNPDFRVLPRNRPPGTPLYCGEEGRPFVIEIKPRYPYDDEIKKCTETVFQLGTTVILFYGGSPSFVLPLSSARKSRGRKAATTMPMACVAYDFHGTKSLKR